MVERIQSELSGKSAGDVIDRVATRLREAVATALASADDVETRRRVLAERRLSLIRELSELRLGLLETGAEGINLDEAHRSARRLLEAHDEFVEAEALSLRVAQEDVTKAEAARDAAAQSRDAALHALEARSAETAEALKQDPDYIALVQASRDASAVAARAEQKLDLARADRAEKGKPYEADPLFSYLWKRGWRTPRYKAFPLIRFLDSWVASLCNYDRHWTNYQRLTELPDRLAEHVQTVEALEAQALAKLDEREAEALAEAGIGALETAVADAKAQLARADAALAAAEATHRERAKAHEDALAERSGPAITARRTLDAALTRAGFPELRVLAAQTLTLEDDRVVDDLVRLRSEELALDMSARDVEGLPARRRHELERVEALRAAFRRDGLDSPWVVISGAAVARALEVVSGGELDVGQALNMIRRGVRRQAAREGQDVRFGGRSRDLGGTLPAILGDVLIEVAKQAARSKGFDLGGGPWGGPTPGRRTSMPRPSRPSGGGKRGGGGFRTGGGF